ncbi:MAG: hypothetical protein AB7U29_02135 [Desulfobulbus sp.]
MDAGHLIAIQVSLLYCLLSPLVLLAIYVLFDFLARPGDKNNNQTSHPGQSSPPALWTDEEIDEQLQRS